MRINWDDTAICYSDGAADIEEEFNARMNKFYADNNGMGLNKNALLDKCINTLIDFMDEGLINTCEVISFIKAEDKYIFEFNCIMPDSAEHMAISAKLEVPN